MDRFDICLPLILKDEGGCVDNARDPGGCTNLGITQRTLSEYLGREATKADVRALKPATVAPIYEHRFWDAAHCGSLPAGVDYSIFDAAVQHGPGQAIKFLQRAVGVTADGVCGPLTLEAVAAKAADVIVASIYVQRRAFYQSLPTFVTFGKGWMRRLEGVFDHSLAMARSHL